MSDFFNCPNCTYFNDFNNKCCSVCGTEFNFDKVSEDKNEELDILLLNEISKINVNLLQYANKILNHNILTQVLSHFELENKIRSILPYEDNTIIFQLCWIITKVINKKSEDKKYQNDKLLKENQDLRYQISELRDKITSIKSDKIQ